MRPPPSRDETSPDALIDDTSRARGVCAKGSPSSDPYVSRRREAILFSSFQALETGWLGLGFLSSYWKPAGWLWRPGFQHSSIPYCSILQHREARRDEAGESEGGISSERLSKISGLSERGELGARSSRSAGLTAVVKSCTHAVISHISYPEGEGEGALAPLI